MVATPHKHTACLFQNPIDVVATNKDAAAEMESSRAQHYTSVFYAARGWTSRTKIASPAQGEKQFLTCPLIYLCLEHVDNLGAYARIPSGDRPSHPIWFRQL